MYLFKCAFMIGIEVLQLIRDLLIFIDNTILRNHLSIAVCSNTHPIRFFFSLFCPIITTDGTHDLLGKATTTLREWLFSWCELSLLSESGEPGQGTFIIDRLDPLAAEEVKQWPMAFEVKTSADKIARTDGVFSKSDPFFEIKHQPSNSPQVITLHRSNVIKKSIAPQWESFQLSVADIGGMDQEFTLKVFDWDPGLIIQSIII